MSLRQLLHQTQPWRALQQPPEMHCLLSIFRAFSILRPEVPVELPRGSSSVHQVQLPRRLPCSSSDPLGSGFSIDVVDSDLWPASFALLSDTTQSNECPDGSEQHEGDELHDSDDEIDDMRQRKKLFYKLDRGPREFEENNVPLRRRKTDKTSGKNPKECKEEQPAKSVSSNAPKPKEKHFVREDDLVVKRERMLTFNQMTDPYRHPFCLDIHVTKGSLCACFVHRVTSQVVVVAHSLSKDMKFGLGSKKGKGMKACAAVGALLAKRAIEDDIHNAVYTPRKGDRIEGKIEVVLHAITENGVDVKVKLKQRKPIKGTALRSMISPSDSSAVDQHKS